jgi:hypothetical protein
MAEGREIHRDRGLDHDDKYSKWRRNVFPKLVGNSSCYCSDLDWVEWRKGNPVALLECRRALGGRTLRDVIDGYYTLNNGFQLEMLAKLSSRLQVPGYLVAIKDENEQSQQFEAATFLVARVIPPNPWPSGRLNIRAIQLDYQRELNEKGYADFINSL